jgi:hypothetical protein
MVDFSKTIFITKHTFSVFLLHRIVLDGFFSMSYSKVSRRRNKDSIIIVAVGTLGDYAKSI